MVSKFNKTFEIDDLYELNGNSSMLLEQPAVMWQLLTSNVDKDFFTSSRITSWINIELL